MKNQDLFSSKDKSKILKCRLLQLLFGALSVNGFRGNNAAIFTLLCHPKWGPYLKEKTLLIKEYILLFELMLIYKADQKK